MSTTAVIGLARSRFGVSLPLVIGLVVFAAELASGPRLLGDPDTYWHIATGRWIIAHHAVPHVDVFSNSVPGAPSVAYEWLSQVVIAAAYDRFGWAGPIVAAAFAFAAAMAILTRLLLRSLDPAYALLGMATAWGLALPHLLARPHILALPLLVLWLGALVRARDENRVPAPWVALIMLAWANLHASYMLGLVLLALLAGEAVVTAPDRRAASGAARGWAIFCVLALAAALATPNGFSGFWLPIHLLSMQFTMGVVTEFQSPNFQQFQPLEAWLLLGLFGALTLGVRLPWTRTIMLLALLHLALTHVRNADVLGPAVPLVLAAPLAAELRRRAGGHGVSWLDGMLAELAKPARAAGAALVAVLGLLIAAVPISRGVAHPDDANTPAAALAAVQADHIAGPVFNDYGFGGYLIFSGVAPFIDGRADVYGDAFMKRFVEATHAVSPDLPQLLDQYHITWTLLAAKSTGVLLMDRMPGWRRLYADDVAVVHIRER